MLWSLQINYEPALRPQTRNVVQTGSSLTTSYQSHNWNEASECKASFLTIPGSRSKPLGQESKTHSTKLPLYPDLEVQNLLVAYPCMGNR